MHDIITDNSHAEKSSITSVRTIDAISVEADSKDNRSGPIRNGVTVIFQSRWNRLDGTHCLHVRQQAQIEGLSLWRKSMIVSWISGEWHGNVITGTFSFCQRAAKKPTVDECFLHLPERKKPTSPIRLAMRASIALLSSRVLFKRFSWLGQRWNNDRDFAVAVRYAQKFLQIILR